MIRTDLALERNEMINEKISGVESAQTVDDDIKITHIKITTDEGAERIGKPKGNYITVEIPQMSEENEELCKKSANVVGEELKKLIKNLKNGAVLIVGLGNSYITPDSIGPKAVSNVFVTRHINLLNKDFEFNFRDVSAISPGVLGLTGIETTEIVEGVKRSVNPDFIIAIDALASRKLSRLGTTVQLSDTGINPGSGVGNNRKELSKESLGVPVIAIGVPMVVDAFTLAEDIFGESPSEDNKLKEVLHSENMVVTPSNVDIIVKQASLIISEAINYALHDM